MAGALRVVGVVRAHCSDHAGVVLRDDECGEELAVRVDAGSARSIAAELAEIPSEAALFLDLLQTLLKESGLSLSGLDLAPDLDVCTLRFQKDGAGRCIPRLPPGAALLMAARLGLPIRVRSTPMVAAPSAVPEAFRDFIAGLEIE